MSLPTVHLTGRPYEQGFRHGSRLRDAVRHNMAVYFDRFWQEGGLTRDDVLARARQHADTVASQNPAYEAGMQGIADGAGTPYLDVVALNVRYEILYYQNMVRQMCTGRRDGCTAFAVAPPLTASGSLLLGQNWDWIPEVRGAIVHTTFDDGLETLAFTEAGVFGGKIGLNNAGLGLAINGMSTTEDDWSVVTKPFHIRCYEILRQRALTAAVAVVEGEQRACSANFLIAQLPDSVVNIEAAPRDTRRLRWMDGMLVHANHFVDPGMLGVEEPPDEYRVFSCRREARLRSLLAGRQPLYVSDLKLFLGDHANAPRSICRHEVEGAPVDEQYRTVTSVIMDLQAGVLFYTDGPPCSNAYRSAWLRSPGALTAGHSQRPGTDAPMASVWR